MQNYNLEDITDYLPEEVEIEDQGNIQNGFNNIKDLGSAGRESLVFVDQNRQDKQSLIENTKAGFILCDSEIERTAVLKDKVLIRVDNPKLIFSLIANAIFVTKPKFGIHPTAVVHSSAEIHPDVYVGPNVIIGENVKIGKESIIEAGAQLIKNIKLGNSVIIKQGAILGGDGYGFTRDENGLAIKFPHVGTIEIEDHVEIGSCSCIDLGALSETKIGYGSKIDNLVHIGHNVRVGKNVFIAAQSSIGGSSKIGDNVEIWMGVKVKDGSRIANRCQIGLGSIIIKDVEENKRVFGNPGRVFGTVE